jgi:hypothetical protein
MGIINNSAIGTTQTNYDILPTMKDITKVIDYKSGASTAGFSSKPKSQKDIRNMEQNITKEVISKGVYPTLSGPKFNFSNKSTSVGAIKISGLYIYESVTSYSSSLITYPVTASLGTKFQGTGYINARRDGSKLVGSAINANSTQTVDGGPVVKVTKVNPNQVVFAGNQLTTIDRATSGRTTNSRVG